MNSKLTFLAFFALISYATALSRRYERHLKFITAKRGSEIPHEYIVVLNSGSRGGIRDKIRAIAGGEINIIEVFSFAIRGGIISTDSPTILLQLLESPEVARVEQNQMVILDDGSGTNAGVLEEELVFASSYQDLTTNAFSLWGLDRIDQRAASLDGAYSWKAATGAGTDVYVLDTGVRETHVDFEGRAVCAKSFVINEECDDMNGHGTHCAGIIGGRTLGVAKEANMIGVKVLSNTGAGVASGVVNGLNWAMERILTQARPSVISLSFGMNSISYAVNEAVNQCVANGIPVVVAAGNWNTDACTSSPASSSAIAVGASTIVDTRASFSNYGRCVDIFAPGSDIVSAGFTDNYSLRSLSGTSQAAPHVAGVIAQILQKKPLAHPEEIKSLLQTQATKGAMSGIGNESPNFLLYTKLPIFSKPVVTKKKKIACKKKTQLCKKNKGCCSKKCVKQPSGLYRCK